MRIDLYLHGDSEVGRKLDQILQALGLSARREIKMAADLTALKASVARNTDVTASAKLLLVGLKTKLDELIANSGSTVDPAELQAIADAIGTDAQGLADAITANTPAA